ncbi:MarR family winged helix-turn-helix transcriptional regulator [Dactylosporangium sp. CA-092794]|uniref:MarR family winged helix-turn-helix transcriptional regulator n=1 Tax=Dactylosporangium sp. CA-092794 TaxID=3239929 RepID=UPI003D8E070E
MRSRPSPHPSGPDDAAAAAALVDTAGQALVLATSAANDNSGVSAAQLRVLGVVDQAGSVNLTQLAVALHTAPSSASRLCDRLEAADLLRRTADERDRREVWLVLTPTARRLLDGLGRQRQETIAAVLRRMPPDDRAALLQGLTSFARASGVPLAEDEGSAAQAS